MKEKNIVEIWRLVNRKYKYKPFWKENSQLAKFRQGKKCWCWVTTRAVVTYVPVHHQLVEGRASAQLSLPFCLGALSGA